jgi:hypothetical protein
MHLDLKSSKIRHVNKGRLLGVVHHRIDPEKMVFNFSYSFGLNQTMVLALASLEELFIAKLESILLFVIHHFMIKLLVLLSIIVHFMMFKPLVKLKKK